MFTAYCPFHRNTYDPSFAINKTNGTYICFNPGCAQSGKLEQLVKSQTDLNEFQVLRLIQKKGGDVTQAVQERIQKELTTPQWEHWQPGTVERLHEQFWQSAGHDYMRGRGFTDETLAEFQIGFSSGAVNGHYDKVLVPFYEPQGKFPIGVIGRSIEGKQFKNSRNLPKSKTLFNIHKARQSETCVIVEASFDVMRLWQAGFKGAVGVIGGYISPEQFDQLDKYFNTVVIATDFDKLDFLDKDGNPCPKCGGKCRGHNAGRNLGNAIAGTMRDKAILWAAWGNGIVYPHDAKDISDLTDDEIIHVVKNAVPEYEYRSWNVEEKQRLDAGR